MGVAICATFACGASAGCKSLVPHRSCKLVALEARNAVEESGLWCFGGSGNGITDFRGPDQIVRDSKKLGSSNL